MVVSHTSRPDTEIFQSLVSFFGSLCGKELQGGMGKLQGKLSFQESEPGGRCLVSRDSLTEPGSFFSLFTILGAGDN